MFAGNGVNKGMPALMQRMSLLAFVVVTIAGIGCRLNDKTNSVSRKESVRREELRRKVDCEKYAGQIRSEWKDEEREIFVKQKLRSEDLLPSIDRLFYSPQRNSCVCVVRDQILVKSDHPSFLYHVFIYDVLTKETIWRKDYFDDSQVGNLDKDIDDQAKHLMAQTPE